MDDIRSASDRVRVFMEELVEHLKPRFPLYAAALAAEIHGYRMTNERWNRIAAILASLAALPGRHFGQEEHDARNPALSAIAVAQKMAAVTFGGRNDVGTSLDTAIYMVEEIEERIERKEASV
jgi:hypothetical protein